MIDHLVVACRTLEQGDAFIRNSLGVSTQLGGRHELMGTHNRLLKLGPKLYLELLAVDPGVPPPSRPRWFALDTEIVREQARRNPYLLTWVARCDEIELALKHDPSLGELHSMTRGTFRWRITIPADGSLPCEGILPTIINWDVENHPADRLEDRGCALQILQLSHPRGDAIQKSFEGLAVDGPVTFQPGPRQITAQILTPKGVVEFR